jgi:hypothetical protein
MIKRKSISKKIRFEVFKRDSFTCQYCGRKSPEIILVIDHIQPFSKGGKDSILNYITSCFDCNSGKSNIELSDQSALNKQRNQLELMQEKKEQITMMLEWKQCLDEVDDQQFNYVIEKWNCLIKPNFSINETGILKLKSIYKKFGIHIVLDSISDVCSKYLKYNDNQKLIGESINTAFDNIEKFCNIKKTNITKPYLKDLFYIRKILDNRFRLSRIDLNEIIALLEKAYINNCDIEKVKLLAKTTYSYKQFYNTLNDFIYPEAE